MLLMTAQAALSAVVFYDDFLNFTLSFPLLVLLINWPLFVLGALVLIVGPPQGELAKYSIFGSVVLCFVVSAALHLVSLPFAWGNGGHLGDASLILIVAPIAALVVASIGGGAGALVSIARAKSGATRGA